MASVRYSSIAAALILVVLSGSGSVVADSEESLTTVELDGTSYKFLPDRVDWETAAATCISHGWSLAILDQCSDLNSVISWIQGGVDLRWKDFWIGGSDLATEGKWMWNNGERIDMSPLYWGGDSDDPEPNGHGNEDCLTLHHRRRHHFCDVSCESRYRPICQV